MHYLLPAHYKHFKERKYLGKMSAKGKKLKEATVSISTVSMLAMRPILPRTIENCLKSLAICAAHSSFLILSAQTTSTIQSSAQPEGLDTVGEVNVAATDRDSYQFQTEELPDILAIVNQKLDEQAAVDDSLLAVDPTKLTLSQDASVRVYFVSEGAGYHNTLGINTTAAGIDSGNPLLIFPDASSRNRFIAEAASNQEAGRNNNNPLAPGDFVDLGTVEAGSNLDFFLIANGAYGGGNVYTTDAALNPDGINHTVALANGDSPYLVHGFEDLFGGGDRDFNDIVFAVDIGAANVAAITATPEPALTLMLGFFGAAASWRVYRKRQCTSLSTVSQSSKN